MRIVTIVRVLLLLSLLLSAESGAQVPTISSFSSTFGPIGTSVTILDTSSFLIYVWTNDNILDQQVWNGCL